MLHPEYKENLLKELNSIVPSSRLNWVFCKVHVYNFLLVYYYFVTFFKHLKSQNVHSSTSCIQTETVQ